MPPANQRIVTAVTWKFVAELCRRHHEHAKLRVYEMHPGGGIYDCLALWSGHWPGGQYLCSFNQQSSHFQLGTPYLPTEATLADMQWPDTNDYVMAYLTAEDPTRVVDQVKSLLGLPHRPGPLPPTTAPVLGIRLIAEFLARHAFARFGFDARSGYFDTASQIGSSVRDELKAVPAIRDQFPAGEAEQDRFARRFWLIYSRTASGDNGPARAILDLRGILHQANPPHNIVPLWALYQANRSLQQLLEMLESICE